MAVPESWSGVAFNPVPNSENRIHGDEVARTYGFRGGLVPGVVVSAYLAHPAAVAWGRDWLERGAGHVTVHTPVYDAERFEVVVESATASRYDARLEDPRGAACATGAFALPDVRPEPPERRGDPPVGAPEERPASSPDAFRRMREEGMGALHVRWTHRAEITHYLRDADAVAPVFRTEGLASPAFVLALSNWVLAANVRLDAWLHLETRCQHFRAVESGDDVVVEARVVDLFQKRGHHFVDLDVAAFVRNDLPAARIALRAIHRLRR